MAANALSGRIPVFVVRFVTVNTVCFQVFAKQLEVGENVIEGDFIQPKNVGVAAPMIGMAGSALISIGFI